mgnify:CR=1 FL=1
MEDSKLQKLHETLKALAPKGKVGGLGFYAKAGHRSRRSAADGMPEDKRALYSFFVRAGDGPSGHTHFADDGDKKLKKKKKKKKTKAPPPPSSDESSSSSSSEDEAPSRKRLADIDAAYESAQAAKARSIDEAFAASQASAAAPKKKKRKNGAAPVKKEKKRKKSKKKDR